jgi:hypothetical protein
MKRVIVQFILLLTISLSVIGCERSSQQINEVMAGDKLYITEGYTTKLSSMKLTEVVSLPYFTKPIICVAKDENGQQFAVLFHSIDEVESVKLPITYENIIKRIESEGFKVKLGTSSFQNIHLFQINNTLYWNFNDGTGKLYLSLNGEVERF